MALVWEQIVVDCHDPATLGRWWTQALSWVVVNDSAHEFEIRETPDRLPGLIFTPAGDPKIGKNRLHIDLRPDDQAAEVARLLALGATKADIGQGEQPWEVLADPEGNEFCVLAHHQQSARVSATTDETTPS
ncbi:MAG TPA: glyoxalase [Micromonosporaceae bacterium]|nr:glyoxalase [Micromonosporaceae bacterium]